MQGLFDIVAIPFGWLMWLCYNVVKNYGWALIIFTVITKVMMVPLSIKQQKSSAMMAYLKPKQDEIRRRYAKNQAKMNEELQKLFAEEGQSPFSGCLPMLITFPVLFGIIGVVYRPLTHILRFSKETVEAIKNAAIPIGEMIGLGEKIFKSNPELQIMRIFASEKGSELLAAVNAIDPAAASSISGFKNTFIGINFAVTPTYTSWLILIPIFAGLTAIMSSYISMSANRMKNSDGSVQPFNAGTLIMIFVMPLISFLFAMGLPSGVGFYWIVSNVVITLQTFVLSKFFNPTKMKEEIEEQMRLRKEKMKQQRAKAAEARKRLYGEQKDEPDEKELTEEEKQEKIQEKKEAIERLNEARRRDAEKYGEKFVEATENDLR